MPLWWPATCCLSPHRGGVGARRRWPVALLLAAAAVALFFRRSHPVAVVAVVAAGRGGGDAAPPLGFQRLGRAVVSLYAVAVVHTRRFALATLAAATAPLALLYFLLAVGPLDGRLPDTRRQHAGELPADYQHRGRHQHRPLQCHCHRNRHLGPAAARARAGDCRVGGPDRAARSVNERNRIAREMHDVVAHSLTVMISLSDGAAVVVRKDPDAPRRCSANCPGPAGRPWRTCGACSGVLRDDSAAGAGAAGAARGRRQPRQAAGGLPRRRTAAALLAHRAGPAGRRGVPADRVPDRAGVADERAALRPCPGPGGRGGCARRSTVTIDVVDDGRGSVDAGGSPRCRRRGIRRAVGTGQGLAGMLERARIYAGTVEAGRERGPAAGVCRPSCTGTATTKARAHESRGTDEYRTDPRPAGGRPAAAEDGLPADPGGRGRPRASWARRPTAPRRSARSGTSSPTSC